MAAAAAAVAERAEVARTPFNKAVVLHKLCGMYGICMLGALQIHDRRRVQAAQLECTQQAAAELLHEGQLPCSFWCCKSAAAISH
jgi:hypothetical protein